MSTASGASQSSRQVDPTRTVSLRKEFAQRLRGIWQRINAQARRDIVKRDVFGLHSSSSATAARDPAPLSDSSRLSDATIIERFRQWLRQQARRGREVLFTSEENTYLRSAYRRGLDQTDAALRAQGAEIEGEVPPEALVGAAVLLGGDNQTHADSLATLRVRAVNDWEGVAEATVRQASREVADALDQRLSPTDTADVVADRINKVAKKRSTDLAYTNVVRAHAQATLNRAEQLGVEMVAGLAETQYRTANDSNVCPKCAPFHNKIMTLAEARGLIPQHPRCRCWARPLIGG